MKIEPKKAAKLPKYAAALAVLCAVPMLAGCGGEPELAGAAEESDPHDYSSTDGSLDYDGEVWVDSPEERTAAEQFAENAQTVLQKAFADAGLDDSYVPENFHGEADSVLYHCGWTALGFEDSKNRVMVCFFDGAAPASFDACEESVPDCENLSAWYAHFAKQTFDWGCADLYTPQNYGDTVDYRIAFVDIAKMNALTAEDAAKILDDLLTAFPETGEEETP